MSCQPHHHPLRRPLQTPTQAGVDGRQTLRTRDLPIKLISIITSSVTTGRDIINSLNDLINSQFIKRTLSDRFPKPLAVIISVFLKGALMERGILASLAAIAIANEEAGPAELL